MVIVLLSTQEQFRSLFNCESFCSEDGRVFSILIRKFDCELFPSISRMYARCADLVLQFGAICIAHDCVCVWSRLFVIAGDKDFCSKPSICVHCDCLLILFPLCKVDYDTAMMGPELLFTTVRTIFSLHAPNLLVIIFGANFTRFRRKFGNYNR